jgi:HEAT repeat protein
MNSLSAKLNSPQRMEVISAVKDLILMRDEDATKLVAERLKTENDNYVKVQIIEMLASDNSKTALDAIVGSISDPDPQVKTAAIRSLGYSCNDEVVVKELTKVLNSSKNEDSVKEMAVSALGVCSSSSAVQAVENVLKDKKATKQLRVKAVRSLGKMGSPEAKNKLGKYTNDAQIKDTVNETLAQDRKIKRK